MAPQQSAQDWAQWFEAEMAKRLGPDGSHDLGHLRRVWQSAQRIQAAEGGDMLVLAASAWLHDLVNPPKDGPDRARASTLSAEAAAPILAAAAFPADKIPAVQHAIRAHSFSAGIAPETAEARILQDADRLDAIGAIGVARCFYVAGRMGSALFDPSDPEATARPLDDTAFALDHFQRKLFPIARSLHTATARLMAEQRVAVMSGFVADLLAEIDAPAPKG